MVFKIEKEQYLVLAKQISYYDKSNTKYLYLITIYADDTNGITKISYINSEYEYTDSF